MKFAIYPVFILGYIFFSAEKVSSQDVNPFSTHANKFSVGFQLSGSFPVGSFTNADISFPNNSLKVNPTINTRQLQWDCVVK